MRSDFARCTLVGLLTFSLFCIACKDGELSGSEEDNNKEEVSPYVTKVLEYVPAPGFFVNLYPEYEVGDNEETMREKALLAIGGSSYEFVTLGGYGGYVVLGFDHTIENVPGERDFLILGNVFYSTGPFDGASCEPGIVMVAYDANGNGEPDDDEWFEIAGSAHVDSTAEEWYETALLAGSDIEFYNNFEINYLEQSDGSIIWSDNKGGTGSAVAFYRVGYHFQRCSFRGAGCLRMR